MQGVQARRGVVGLTSAVLLPGHAIFEAACELRTRGPLPCLHAQFHDAAFGAVQPPVHQGIQQAEQHRGIELDLQRQQRLRELQAPRLHFAGTVGQHALHRVGQVHAFMRLADAARGHAGNLLAANAGLPRAVDLVAQGTQAGTVDPARGGERGHAFQRGGQRLGEFPAELAQQFLPTHGRGIAAGGFAGALSPHPGRRRRIVTFTCELVGAQFVERGGRFGAHARRLKGCCDVGRVSF
jgi:hypothetical protein